jgi:hypothetical protein
MLAQYVEDAPLLVREFGLCQRFALCVLVDLDAERERKLAEDVAI